MRPTLDRLDFALGGGCNLGDRWALCLAMASSVLWFGELRKPRLRRGDGARLPVEATPAQPRISAGA